MKKNMITLAALALMLIGFGCSSSSSDDDAQVELIVGSWTSQGEDVAPGLAGAPFNTVRIDAVFNENGTYNVVSIDANDAQVTFTGTYELGPETPSGIRQIILSQSEPVAVTSTGIFQVDGNRMTYEVIQTTPAIENFNPPTVEGGFGSTSFGTVALGPTWIQRYSRNN
ncbi:MAG: hypothetical protein JJU41_10950 [Bacteroidetes bacterium]|nr:hypothetical protein [Bacteroidota bacterium]MCH8523919.1 hypothetical protein [Balneolales bacterium]